MKAFSVKEKKWVFKNTFYCSPLPVTWLNTVYSNTGWMETSYHLLTITPWLWLDTPRSFIELRRLVPHKLSHSSSCLIALDVPIYFFKTFLLKFVNFSLLCCIPWRVCFKEKAQWPAAAASALYLGWWQQMRKRRRGDEGFRVAI